jgi:hypothetical protein
MGSDSFLDIIANIVGILIILIVVAGMRVSNAPVVTAAVLPDSDVPKPTATEVEVAVAPKPEPPEPDPDPPSPVVLEPSPELLELAKNLEADLAEIEFETSTQAADLQHVMLRTQGLKRRLDSTTQALMVEADDLADGKRRLARLSNALDQIKGKLLTLQHQLDRAKREKSPVKQVPHKMTPLSREVRGKELHFRLADAKVAYVPINELVERLRPQIARQTDWLIKHRRHEGQIGPVFGFIMNYVVERLQLTVLEELRRGRGMMRIGVTNWTIVPDSDLNAEPAETALSLGSKFIRTLQTAEPGTTLTFWVYPDSFKLYRHLQQFAHNEGFTVAARPLPFGVPIAGSPNGTRSAGQ